MKFITSKSVWRVCFILDHRTRLHQAVGMTTQVWWRGCWVMSMEPFDLKLHQVTFDEKEEIVYQSKGLDQQQLDSFSTLVHYDAYFKDGSASAHLPLEYSNRHTFSFADSGKLCLKIGCFYLKFMICLARLLIQWYMSFLACLTTAIYSYHIN